MHSPDKFDHSDMNEYFRNFTERFTG